MTSAMLFHPEHRLGKPVLSLFLIFKPCVSHGQKEVVERRTSLAEDYRSIEGGNRGLEIAGAILNGPQGIPVGAAFRMHRHRLDGQRKGAGGVSHGQVGRGHQKPGQIVGAVTPLLAMS